jgi:hypothetical protein
LSDDCRENLYVTLKTEVEDDIWIELFSGMDRDIDSEYMYGSEEQNVYLYTVNSLNEEGVKYFYVSVRYDEWDWINIVLPRYNEPADTTEINANMKITLASDGVDILEDEFVLVIRPVIEIANSCVDAYL